MPQSMGLRKARLQLQSCMLSPPVPRGGADGVGEPLTNTRQALRVLREVAATPGGLQSLWEAVKTVGLPEEAFPSRRVLCRGRCWAGRHGQGASSQRASGLGSFLAARSN